jgi:LemA protein
MDIGLIVIGLIVLVALIVVLMFNGLVQKRNRVENAWSQIDVQLKKRYDLVPNLVETVKGYAKQEKTVFEEVTKARAAIMKAGNVTETAEANNMLTGALKSLFAVAENYPQLKSSQNFLALQEELSGIEGKIAATRQFYNDAVLDYDNAIEQFPGNVMAGIFGFKEKPYFEIEEAARQNVKVSF